MTAPEWTLHLGDCIAGLASLPDRSIDVCLTDPPYSRGLYTRWRTNGRPPAPAGDRPSRPKERPRGPRRSGVHDRAMSTAYAELANERIGAAEDIAQPVAQHLLRVCRRWIVVFCDEEATGLWLDAFGGRTHDGGSVVRVGIAVKANPMPQVSGDRPAAGHEVVIVAHASRVKGEGPMRWNGGGRAAVWTYPAVTQHDRPAHPCPKPLPLMAALVRDFSDRGETILDPFAGSGTTGVAAIAHGRRFIGWERDPEYHEVARKRLAMTREQLGLFATEAV